MTYYKNITDNYIASISTSCGQIPIIKSEYNAILEVIHNKPTAPEGFGYRLKTELTWELYALPEPEPIDDELTAEEALKIITGGAE